MYPHRIRLRGPWDCEPLAAAAAPRRVTMPCRWGEAGLVDFGGRVRCRRRFGYPGRIDPHERIWLTLEGAADRVELWLNGTALGRHSGERPLEFEVTALLGSRNELVVDVEGPADRGGLWGEVALEVRCRAYLRGVRAWLAGATELRVAGEVVGDADGPLELYLIYERRTVAYAPAAADPAGVPFHLAGEVPAVVAGQAGPVKVDLVNGATVWYTWEQVLTPLARPPA
jgi:hypothetical protein